MEETVTFEQNRFYSATHVELIDLLTEDMEMTRHLPVTDIKAMQNYEHIYSNWPVVISQARVCEFDDFIKALPAVILKVIKLYYGKNFQDFADYINESPFVCEILLGMELDPRDLSLRHDIIISDQRMKLLEINAGTSFGGWHLDWIYPSFVDVINSYESTAQWDLNNRAIVEAMFIAILNSIKRSGKAGAQGNVVIVLDNLSYGEYSDDIIDHLVQQCTFAQKKSYPNSQVICVSHDALEFKINGEVYCQGKMIDAVIIPLYEGIDVNLKSDFYFKLLNSMLKGKLVFPDSPVNLIIGNKNILALLYKAKDLLTEKEQGFIESYIPWTTKLENETVNWKNQEVALNDLLFKQQEQFVLKRAHSMGGRDVFIGKDCSREEWQEAILDLRDDSNWLVQEYCEPDLMSVCYPAIGVTPVKTIWGIFDFGGNYSGAFVRATPSKEVKGPINSAGGAAELLVLEEAPKIRRLTL
jgi:hypothetical protein